jgi:Na+-translocating ferredoxin:NAD+ oxidoreductase RNF subunit RnfB
MFDDFGLILASIFALTLIGAFFGLILSVANKKLYVKQDPRVEKIIEILPGVNCGACGQPGCSGYAVSIVEKSEMINLCPVGGAELVTDISRIMGVDAEFVETKLARVHCTGGLKNTRNKYDYQGPRSCAAAQQINGGFRVCTFGCLGLGDCMRSCPFNAIYMDDNNLPVVDKEKCTGCGNCVTECPRDIISLENAGIDVYVMCNNKEKGAIMKQGCQVGCIGCQLCVKNCKTIFENNAKIETAVTVDNFLAKVNSETCINCGKCSEVCPVKVITFPVKEVVSV